LFWSDVKDSAAAEDGLPDRLRKALSSFSLSMLDNLKIFSPVFSFALFFIPGQV
jgi:hypothetical protein